MANQNTPLQILIEAKLNEAVSSDNIEKQLAKISKKVDIGLDTNGLKKVQQQLNELQSKVDKVTINTIDEKGIKNSINAIEGQLRSSMQKIANDLKNGNNKVTFKELYDVDGAKQELKGFQATVQDLQGKIKRTLTYVPTGGGSTQLKQITETVVDNTDKIDKKIKSMTDSAKANLEKLNATGKITAEQFSSLSNKLSGNIGSIDGVKNINKEIQETVKNNRLAEQSTIKRANAEKQTQQEIQGILNKNNSDYIKQVKQLADLNEKIKAFQRNVNVSATNLQSRNMNNPKALMNATDSQGRSLEQLKEIAQNISSTMPDASSKMKDVNTGLKEIGANAQMAGGRMMTFGGNVRRAAEGLLMWTGVGSIIYGSIHAFQDMISTIIDVDTQMTQLKRVMSSGTDYTTMFQQMLNLSKELGRSFDDVAANAQEFAKQGFDQTQVVSLTKVATLLQNISDLNPQESMNALMSGIQNFGINAKDSIKIANSLNEVDNNYSVSTQQLATSMAKAGSTAKAYHVSLSEVIGETTAVGAATRESGSVIGNFLKTLYSRLETMPKSVNALKSIGISVKDNNGQMKSASKVLGEMHDRWSTLSDEQKQYLALSVGGAQQLNRLYALMNNYNQALDAQKTAENSAGSAQRENSRYMDSYAAKIQQLHAQWTELQVTMGKAVVSDSLVASVTVLTKLASAATLVVKYFGVLPVVFGTVSSALILMSKNFRTTAATEGIFATVTKGLTISMDALKVSMRGLLMASGVGLVFAGIGFAVEKLINIFSEYQAQQAKIQKQVDSQTNSYKKHADEIDHLKNRYSELSKASANGGLSSAQSKEYEDVQNRLNKLLPSVTDHIDKENNAHLKSASVVSSAVDQYKKLSKAKSAAIVADLPNQLEKANKNIDKAKQSLKDLQASQNIKGNINDVTAWKVTVPATPKENVENLNKQVIKSKELQVAQEKLKSTFKSFAGAYADSEDASNKLTDADKKYISSIVDHNSADLKTENGQKRLQNQIIQTTNNFLKLREAFGKGISSDSIGKMSDIMGKVDFSKVKDPKDFTKNVEDLTNQFMKGEITNQQYTDGLHKYGFTVEQAKDATAQMAREQGKQAEASKTQQKALVDITSAMQDASKYADALSHALSGEKVSDDMPGQLQRVINGYKVLNALAEQNGGATKLDAEQQQFLSQTIQELNAQFPQFVNGRKINIAAIQQQIDIDKAVQQAETDAANGTITASRAAALAQAESAKSQIKSIQDKIKALNIYQTAYDQYVKNMSDKYNQLDTADQLIATRQAIRMSAQAKAYGNSDALKSTKKYQAELAKLEKQSKSYVSAGGQLLSTNEDVSDSTDSATKSITKYTYVHDKLSERLAKVNGQYQVLNSMTERYDKASSKYRSSISKEISLLKQKNDILKAQAKALEQQIKSGNIVQYGEQSTTYDVGGSSSSGSTSGGSTPSSWTAAIKSAASAMGVSLTKSALNTILKRIKQESGGSETITNNWDSNAKAGHPSTGLLQYIQSTFNRYAVAGHTNIHSGYDQLLAMFNDSNWLADISGSGGWGPTGSKRRSSIGGGSSSSGSSTIGQAAADQQAAIVQAKSNLYDLQQQIIDNENAIQQAYLDIVNSHIEQIENKSKALDDDLAKYKYQADIADQTSKSYIDALNGEKSIISKQEKIEQEKANYILDQYKHNKNLNEASRADLLQQYQDTISSLYDLKGQINDLNNSIKEVYQNLSDSVIQQYKDMYQQQIDAAQKAHDKQIDFIQDLEDQIDKEDSAKEYADNLKEAQKAVSDLQKQRNNYLMDNSIEGKAKVKDIDSQLADAQKSLEDLQNQHATDERKQALEDQKSSLDDQMSAYEDSINNIINDDTKWTALQEQILSGHYANVLKDFEAFRKAFQSESDLLGSGITNSVLAKIKDLSDQIENLGLKSGGKTISTGNISIPKFASGGYTGDWNGNGGILAVLHKREMILNEKQQKALEGSIVQALASANQLAIPNIISSVNTVPNISNVTNNTNSSKGDTILQFHIDKVEGTKEGANSFAKDVLNIVKGRGLRLN